MTDWDLHQARLEGLKMTIHRMGQDAKRRPEWAEPNDFMIGPQLSRWEREQFRKQSRKFNWHVLTGLGLVVGVALITATWIISTLLNIFTPEALRAAIGWAFWAGVALAGLAAIAEALAAVEGK